MKQLLMAQQLRKRFCCYCGGKLDHDEETCSNRTKFDALSSPAEGVEEAARSYVILNNHSPFTGKEDAFKAGALWQSRQGGGGKTLQECKDEIFQQLGYESYKGYLGFPMDELPTGHNDWDFHAEKLDEATELYANQKPQTQEGWVSVEDRLPDTEGSYLCGKQYFHSKAFIQCVYDFKLSRMRDTGELYIDEDGVTGHFLDGLGYGQDVTHWQELPPPPTNEQKQ